MSVVSIAGTGTPGNQLLARVRRTLGSQEGILLLLLVLLFVGVGLYNERFLAWNNVTDLFSVNAYIAVAAIGMSMVIVTGNIDISVGSAIGVLVTLSGYVALGLDDTGLPLPLSSSRPGWRRCSGACSSAPSTDSSWPTSASPPSS